MDIASFLLPKTHTIIIQPTPFCNINCRYCYLTTRSSNNIMKLTTLERILEAVLSSSLIADKITIVWHAGEPMVVPLQFYEHASELIKHYNTRGIRVFTTFQTNGTLITQEWCDYVKRQQVNIGVSLDGPKHIHDAARVDRVGRGTFERTMTGITRLQENGIMPSIIMVLTAYALDYPDEIWQFFCDHHLTKLAFNVEEINGANRRSSVELNRDISRFKQFLRRWLELRDASTSPPTIRDINVSLRHLLSPPSPIFASENTPAALLGFDYLGNVSTYASELLSVQHARYGNFSFGNIFDAPLEELLASKKLQAINTEIQRGVMRCKASCEYFMYCGGGSPVNKLSEHGTFDATETMQCKLRIQATIDTLLEYMEEKEDISRYSAFLG